MDSEIKKDYIRLVVSDWHWSSIWGILIRRSLYTDNCVRLTTDSNLCVDLRTVVPLSYYANRIAGVYENGYHYDENIGGQMTSINRGNVNKKGIWTLNTIREVRSFVEKNIPEYIDLYDTKLSMASYERYLSLSLLYGDKELYSQVKKYHQDVIRMYPSLYGVVKNRLRRQLKYHYWIARPMIQCKFALFKKCM